MLEEKQEKMVTGLRSAVRYGALTKEQAQAKYDEAVQKSGRGSPSFEAWLRRRA